MSILDSIPTLALMELLAIRLSPQAGKSLVIPLQGGGDQTPFPLQGEGWDGGEFSNMVDKLDISNAS